MSRPSSPNGVSRFQVILPTPVREWLESQARVRDGMAKARGDHAVKISHLITRAVEFYMAHPELVDAWDCSRNTTKPRETERALRFYQRFKKPVSALLKEEGFCDGDSKP